MKAKGIVEAASSCSCATWTKVFMRKPMPYANNKGADQPAHPRSLINAFVARCLDSIIPLVSISEILSLHLVSVTAQIDFSLPWSQTPDRFSRDEARIINMLHLEVFNAHFMWTFFRRLRPGNMHPCPSHIKLTYDVKGWSLFIF